jgi:hypothetical protein
MTSLSTQAVTRKLAKRPFAADDVLANRRAALTLAEDQAVDQRGIFPSFS